jgi:hypothetical protein
MLDGSENGASLLARSACVKQPGLQEVDGHVSVTS